mmetsp:Transcript_55587/g.169051  ORF Transcript_55587/g.169051 Transcript_55587/m.169051 type:complete len:231 (+) Transcript_55587:718-1410(+)
MVPRQAWTAGDGMAPAAEKWIQIGSPCQISGNTTTSSPQAIRTPACPRAWRNPKLPVDSLTALTGTPCHASDNTTSSLRRATLCATRQNPKRSRAGAPRGDGRTQREGAWWAEAEAGGCSLCRRARSTRAACAETTGASNPHTRRCNRTSPYGVWAAGKAQQDGVCATDSGSRRCSLCPHLRNTIAACTETTGTSNPRTRRCNRTSCGRPPAGRTWWSERPAPATWPRTR